MALNIKDPDVDRLVRDLAAETGESITNAVAIAARERLERVRGAVPREQRAAATDPTVREFNELAVLDDRSAEEILGFDENGLPT